MSPLTKQRLLDLGQLLLVLVVWVAFIWGLAALFGASYE